MDFNELAEKFSYEYDNVQISTMMGTKCLRFHDAFLGMFFDKADALIVKLPATRVNELLETDEGLEFNYTKKRFKEWVLIPSEASDEFERFMLEALEFAKSQPIKKKKK